MDNSSDSVPDLGQTHEFCVTTSFIRGCCTLLLRAGLIFIQFACIPTTNVNRVIFHNIFEISCATIVYSIFGFVIAFGHDEGGVIGINPWLFQEHADLNDAILGWCCVIITTGLYTTALIGRLHFIAYFLLTLFMSILILPFLMHWAYSGWMYKAKLSEYTVTFKDHGGGMIIHVSAGIVALINGLFLGRRLIRLKDLNEASISSGSSASATVGYFLLIIGLIGFCLPTPVYEMTHEPLNYVAIIFLNSILAAAGGIMPVIVLEYALTRKLLQYWALLRYMQGAVAGVVIVASGVDVYNPLISLSFGVLAGLIYFFIAFGIFFSAFEDYSNIIAIHLVNGFVGSLLPPVAGMHEGFGIADKMGIHLAWQIICDLAIIALVGIPIALLCLTLSALTVLRNHDEEMNHRRAKIASNKGKSRKCLGRLWSLKPNSKLLQPGAATKDMNEEDMETSPGPQGDK